VGAPVPEAVVVAVVCLTLDAVVEGPLPVLEPVVVELGEAALEFEDAVLELEEAVVGLEEDVVELEKAVVGLEEDVVELEEAVVGLEEDVVELEEVIALVQLLEAKAATPSANAASKGAANEAARL